MPKFMIQVIERVHAYYEVEASTREEALENWMENPVHVDTEGLDVDYDSAKVIEELPEQNKENTTNE